MKDKFDEFTIKSKLGSTDVRFWDTGPTKAVIMAGGAGDEWDSPGGGNFFIELADRLLERKISSMRVKFQNPASLEDSIYNIHEAIHFLSEKGYEEIGLIGWSFGGAAVINAAVFTDSVKAIITIASQSYGAEGVGDLPEGCAILFMHGNSDSALPIANSEALYQLAHEPKEIIIFEGANHGLDQVKKEALRHSIDWFMSYLI